MKKKILIGSIFVLLLMLSMPATSNIQAQRALVNEEPEVTSTEKPKILCLFLRGLYNRIVWKLEDPDSNERLLGMLALIVGIPYFTICKASSATTSNAGGCGLCHDV